MDSEKRAAFEDLILEILGGYPGGIKEYDLIQELTRAGYDGFSERWMRDSLTLFRGHFSLFHSLYHLRNRLHKEEAGCLDINSIRITLEPYTNVQADLSASGPLASYYLDVTNLEKTTREDVEKLLEQFWTCYPRFENKDRALAEFGLEEPVDYRSVKSRYRELAKRHHPDHGGDSERFKELNRAMMTLEAIYNPA